MRSLADDLRSRTDEQLAAIVAARPDLLHPVPSDITALAQRAGSPASVAACLRGYDQLALHVVLAAALAPDPVRPTAVVSRVGGVAPGDRGAADRVRAIVHRMRAEALLWGTDRSLHLVGPARDLMVPVDRGPRLAGLDPVVAGFTRDPQSLAALMASAPPGAAAALERLLAGPVLGTVVDARREPDPSRSPIDWLLAHRLLVPLGADRVVMPAEVVSILRQTGADDPARTVIDLAVPAPRRPAPDPARVDPGAVGAVLDVLHRVGDLGRAWSEAPPSRLRTGGIPARDLTRTARALSATEESTALLIEIAATAGLVAADSHDQVSILPTGAFDAWLAQAPHAQHAALLTAWLAMPRSVATTDQRPMSPELGAPALPDLRRDVLRVLDSEPGAWDDGEVVAAIDWWAPRRHDATRAERVRAVLTQGRELGVVVDGTLTSAGRALLVGDGSLADVLAQSLPSQVDHVVLQADLTAIVPGLPTPALGELMRTVADAESTGAASIYRFSTDSVRRALDSGRTAGELLGELGRRGAVPQGLAYLIEDVARRHAVLRIGSAATVLRCDDPVILAGILADPGAAALGLFALSDTVLASDQAPEHVLDRLRQLGHSLLPEPGRGPAVGGPRRARGRPGTSEASTAQVTPALAAAAVRAIRANDRVGSPAPSNRADPDSDPALHPVPTTGPNEIVAVLRSAIATDSAVWIGYADPAGVAGDRRVEPLRLAGGYLTALDLRSETITSFALARITGALRA
ncbi:MAG TPA: helicase-associated domain-containing protein [Motilibacterales bacterium]|nr:helicase-associated domain-containing protein [Motilibacterales bacterium]